MYYEGVLIGVISFFAIGLFHPIVIKTEYYIGKKAWPIFLLVGLGLTVGAIFIESTLISAIVAVVAFSSFWSIKELFEQERRVAKGWFPKNPKKKDKGDKLSQKASDEEPLSKEPTEVE